MARLQQGFAISEMGLGHHFAQQQFSEPKCRNGSFATPLTAGYGPRTSAVRQKRLSTVNMRPVALCQEATNCIATKSLFNHLVGAGEH